MVAYSFKKRFVNPIRCGLNLIMQDDDGNWLQAEGVIEPGGKVAHPFDPYKDLMPEARPKRQTIRADRDRHARPGEVIQLYCGMRTKQCFKIGEARCTSVDPIVLGIKETYLAVMRFKPRPISLDAFAQADGFEHAQDMHAFWLEEHGIGIFKGVLIKWVPL